MKNLKTFFIILLVVIAASAFYFFPARPLFISPLPPGIAFEIRIDDYGDGHFGAKRNSGRQHNGIDLSAPIGTPVLAVRAGKIEKVSYDEKSGNYVVIWHNRELKSYYLHLSKVNVKIGQRVKQGAVIGKVGDTGNARQEGMKPHLHFEIREENVPQDILERWRFGFIPTCLKIII